MLCDSIKEQARNVKHKAILSANKEMMILYWNIGKLINDHSELGKK